MVLDNPPAIDFPADWQLIPLGSVADVIDPQPDHRRPELVDDGYPYVGLADISSDGSIDAIHAKKVSLETINRQRSSFQISPGDIVFGKIGTVGSPRFLPSETVPYALNTSVVLIKPRISPQYVLACLESPLFRKQIYSGVRITSQPRLGIQQIRSLLIPLPPLPEQRKIAAILSTWDDAIRLTEQLIAALKQRKQALMQLLLTGQVRFQGYENWSDKRLEEVTEFITDGVHETPEYTTQGVPFLSVNNLSGDRLDFSGCKFISYDQYKLLTQKYKPQQGDLLVGKVGTIGVCDVIKTSRELAVFVQLALLRPNRLIDAYFLKYVFQHLPFRNYVNSLASGTSLKYIGIGQIARLKIPVPSFDEQQKISRVIMTCDNMIELSEQMADKFRAQKRGLMQQLLTGAIRVQVDD